MARVDQLKLRTRISKLFALVGMATGEPLSQKQARALAGEWYRWFIAQHEENPGTPERWEQNFWALIDRLEEHAPERVLAENWKGLDWLREPQVLNGIRPALAKETKVDQFLADRGHALTEEAYNLFLDCVLGDPLRSRCCLSGERKVTSHRTSGSSNFQYLKLQPRSPRVPRLPKD